MSRLYHLISAAAAAWAAANPAPAAEPVGEPLFSREIAATFSRAGCNSGSCHGAVSGKGGFRLSLFAADPAADHARILREHGGRRIDPAVPEASLLLRKAAGLIPHGGGSRIDPEGVEFAAVRRWIAAGARLDAIDRSRLRFLQVEPTTAVLAPGGRTGLRVTAEFADGSQQDVTALCTFESLDREVVAVDEKGVLSAGATGDAGVVVRFRSDPAVMTVVVPGPAVSPFDFPANNFIDGRVADKLRRLNIRPAEPCDDAAFLRRAGLDIAGILPTPDEVRTFLADSDPKKRDKAIDRLLAHPGHASLWATKFCDILKPVGFSGNYGFVEPAEQRRFHDWIRARLTENLPYDALVERILTADSREGRPSEAWVREMEDIAAENGAKTHELKAYAFRRTLDLYWQREGATGVKGTLQVAHAFLGLRLECAQCHRHPHDVWRQDDLLSFANFFMRTPAAGYNGSSPETSKAGDPLIAEAKTLREKAKKLAEQAKDKKLPKDQAEKINAQASELSSKAGTLERAGKRIKGTEIHVSAKSTFASVSSPLGTQKSEELRLLGAATAAAVPAGQDPRAVVVQWMRRPDNPYFARAIVNRVWAHYFGRGIVDPPDQLSPLNPPSHPELLDELAGAFVRSGCDLRALHRLIAGSRTYQLSSRPDPSGRTDTRNYAAFTLRRLPAEVLIDAINHAAGGSEAFPADLRLPPGARAMELAGAVPTDPKNAKTAALSYALSIFGRPVRSAEVQCDCEREAGPSMAQMLYLAAHPAVREKIAAPDGRAAQIEKAVADPDRRIEEAFLWTVSRPATTAEREAARSYFAASASPRRALEGLLWALINTREFVLNH